MTRYRVLITGAGSLVAKGILDSLEGRRQNLHVIGAGFGDATPTMLRCDEVIRTVPSDHPAFGEQLQQIVNEAAVDLVIPGRDFDVPAVADLDAVTLTGAGAQIATDKWLSYQFAMAHNLPIVHTALPGRADFGAPAVRKPRIGGGSLGVRLLLTQSAFERAQAVEGIVLQPLLGPLPDLDLTDGLPLFWQAPVARQGGVQAVIDPDGEVGIAVAFETQHRFGWVEEQHLVDDPPLLSLGMDYARALATHGWRGPMNIACIWDGEQWLCLELNPRFTGGTAARTAMGFDEVGWTVNRWAGWEVVPALDGARGNKVVQQMAAYPMWAEGQP